MLEIYRVRSRILLFFEWVLPRSSTLTCYHDTALPFIRWRAGVCESTKNVLLKRNSYEDKAILAFIVRLLRYRRIVRIRINQIRGSAYWCKSLAIVHIDPMRWWTNVYASVAFHITFCVYYTHLLSHDTKCERSYLISIPSTNRTIDR